MASTPITATRDVRQSPESERQDRHAPLTNVKDARRAHDDRHARVAHHAAIGAGLLA